MNQNKIDSMDAVGELADFGYPHLPAPTMSQFANKADYEEAIKSQSDAWNEAGTKPDHPCLCLTKNKYLGTQFQYWNGNFFGLTCDDKTSAIAFMHLVSEFQNPIEWREVQP